MDAEFENLVAEFLERREQGESIELEAFAQAHPGHAAELRRVLAGLPALEQRFARAGGRFPLHIGPFRVLREIARGGMGRVLEVEDTRSGPKSQRRYALKLLDGAGSLSERGRERFAREAAVLARIEHPGVVRVVELGEQSGVPWLAMELLEGETLAARIDRLRSVAAREAPVERWREAASIVARLARAAEAVHAAGLVHRDIKPANVIMADDGRVVLIDFGLVKDQASDSLTHSGDLLGTPQYMSPEQARGERADAGSDIYGLGAVLFELLLLRPPHEGPGTSSDPLHALLRARHTPVGGLRRHAPRVPRELDWIASSALAFRRAQRAPSAAWVAQNLEAWLAGAPVQARPPSLARRAEDFVRRERKRLATVCLLALVLGATGLGLRRWLGVQRRAAVEQVQAALLEWLERDASVASEGGAAQEPSISALADSRAPFATLVAGLLEDRTPQARGSEAEQAATQGWRDVRERRDPAGLEALRRARELARGSAVPIVVLARAAERLEQWDVAAREYRAAIEQLPERAPLYARLSYAHYARKEDAEAERAIRKAIELAPQRAEHHFALARVLARQKRGADGLAAALRGAELAGQRANASQLQILSALLGEAKRYDEAQEVLRRLLERDPDNQRALYNLSLSYLSSHDYVPALEALAKITRDPHRARALASLAFIYGGANSDECEECRGFYAAQPELLDQERAEALALQALEGEFSNDVPLACADIARRIDRRAALRARLEELERSAQDDARIAALSRARRMLE